MKLNKKLVFWQQTTKLHPDFPDAYLKLALLNSQIGHHDQALNYLNGVLKSDPNNLEVKEVQKVVEGN